MTILEDTPRLGVNYNIIVTLKYIILSQEFQQSHPVFMYKVCIFAALMQHTAKAGVLRTDPHQNGKV